MLLLALAVASSAGARVDVAAEATRISDPTGDSGAAPDIRYVDVGNDVVRGPIVIWIETPNRPRLASGDLLEVYIDADLDPATGLYGIDHVIAGDAAGGILARWNGTDFAQVPAPTLSWRQFTGWVRIAIHPSDLAGTRAFNYLVVSSNGDDADVAPDDSFASYSLGSGPLQLGVERFALNPRLPRAGARVTAQLLAVRHDTAEPLTDGTVACTVRLAGRPIASRRGRADGAAFCTVLLPRTARGKVLSVRLSVTYAGRTVARTWTGRVR